MCTCVRLCVFVCHHTHIHSPGGERGKGATGESERRCVCVLTAGESTTTDPCWMTCILKRTALQCVWTGLSLSAIICFNTLGGESGYRGAMGWDFWGLTRSCPRDPHMWPRPTAGSVDQTQLARLIYRSRVRTWYSVALLLRKSLLCVVMVLLWCGGVVQGGKYCRSVMMLLCPLIRGGCEGLTVCYSTRCW